MTLADGTHFHALQAFSSSHGDGQHLAIPGSCSVCAESAISKVGLARGPSAAMGQSQKGDPMA